MFLLFLEILLFAISITLTVWILGVGLVSALHPRAKLLGANILLGIPLLALTIWLPFVFGWING